MHECKLNHCHREVNADPGKLKSTDLIHSALLTLVK